MILVLAVPFTSVTSVSAANIFEDGFETGDFRKWSPVGGNPVVASGDAHHGNYKAVLDGAGEYAQLRFAFAPVDHGFMRAYVMFKTFPANGSQVTILGLWNFASSRYMTEARVINDGGIVKWRMRYYNNGAYFYANSELQLPSLETWYCIEVEARSNTATSAESRIYINGNELADITQIAKTNNLQINSGYLWVNSPGSIHWYDCVVINSAYIGPGCIGAVTDTLLWKSDVYSSGKTVTPPVLELGRTYRIEVAEIFWYNYTANLAADAMYYTNSSPYWSWRNFFSLPSDHAFLQINEMDVNWGQFSGSHTYSVYYVGQGTPITFRIVDWMDGNYTNNNCHLPVWIFETTKPLGLTPGFWKNHPEAWPGTYGTNPTLGSIFGTCAPDGTLVEALRFRGGSGISGAKLILSRAAAAALLNAEMFGASYHYTAAQLIQIVSYQFCHGTRFSILEIATQLDYWNNVGVPPDWSPSLALTDRASTFTAT